MQEYSIPDCYNCGNIPTVDIHNLKVFCDKCGLSTGFKKKHPDSVFPEGLAVELLIDLWRTLPKREPKIIENSTEGLFRLSLEQIKDLHNRGYTFACTDGKNIRKVTKDDLVFLKSEVDSAVNTYKSLVGNI